MTRTPITINPAADARAVAKGRRLLDKFLAFQARLGSDAQVEVGEPVVTHGRRTGQIRVAFPCRLVSGRSKDGFSLVGPLGNPSAHWGGYNIETNSISVGLHSTKKVSIVAGFTLPE
jgi:hypothetical protein